MISSTASVASVCSCNDALPLRMMPPTATWSPGSPGKVDRNDARMTRSSIGGATTPSSPSTNPTLPYRRKSTHSGFVSERCSAGTSLRRARVSWMSSWRIASPSSSRNDADRRAWVPTSCWMTLSLKTTDVHGVITEKIRPSSSASSSIALSSASRRWSSSPLAPSMSPVTSSSPVGRKRTTTTSPPKRSWKNSLSWAIWESLLR